jgi:hypothetical protein
MRQTARSLLLALALFLAWFPLASPIFAQHEHAAGGVEKLGKVEFRVSCSADVQQQFNLAVGLLHSFWYDRAASEFGAITKKDPSCGMAHWGVAMTIYHPLWEPPPPAALQQGWEAVEKATKAGANTDREKQYIAAIETFYKDYQTRPHPQRAADYEKAMERLHIAHPDDREATVFYALALLGSAAASPGDKTYARQKKAGSLAEELFKLQPDHPGLAHYIIHSYDYPSLAARAEEASRRYAAIAPDSPHALHMPSHIFTRLGLWEQSVSSNLASAAAGQKNGLASDQLHALDYVMYAYLQMGRDEAAQKLAENLPKMSGNLSTQFAGLYAAAAIPARYALERRDWKAAAALEPPYTAPEDRLAWTQANIYFARAIGAARMGIVPWVNKAVEELYTIRQALLVKDKYWAEQVRIQEEIAIAWLTFASDSHQEALELMRAAADHEDSTDKHPVTPGVAIPARELLADMLLEAQRPAAALTEYEAVLRAAPNRFNALLGAAKAAQSAGETSKARSYYSRLLEIARGSTRPELQQAAAYLASK